MTGAGLVVWITGLPSAGKSTFAERLEARLRLEGRSVCRLDGDEVRRALVPAPGYGAEERAQFYATLTNLAVLLAGQGHVVLVAATAHRREFRERARRLAQRYVEVFVDASPETVQKRDSKQLYAAERAGSVDQVPGADLEYEPPLAPDLVVRGGKDEAGMAALLVLLGAG